jgi:GAF domain-containing protein/anti-sigma regulatory factor (Ser/Thr protein kinase)
MTRRIKDREQRMSAHPEADSDPQKNPDGEAMLLAVYRAAERVTAELDLDRALEEIIACVRGPLGLDRAGVFLYRPRKQDLVRLVGVGDDGTLEYGPEASIPIEDRRGPMQQVALGLIPFFHSHDVRRDVAAEVRMPPGLRAHAIVPLVNRGEIIGVMAVDNQLTGRDIPEGMIRPLCLFAQFAAMALGNALRANDLIELNAKLRRLAELSGGFSANLRPDSLLREALAGVPELLGADRYAAWRRHPGSGWDCAAVHGLSEGYLEIVGGLYRRDEGEQSAMERLICPGEPHFLREARSSSLLEPYGAAVEQEGFRSVFTVPLCHGSDLLGCVDLYYDQPPDLSDHDWEIARLFARHAGTALRNAELFEARAALDQQLRQANQELAADRQLLIARQEELRHGEALKKQFYRDVLYCMTNGKLVLCDQEEIARDWTKDLAAVAITGTEDIKRCRDEVVEHARAGGMSEERVNDLCLCTSEAATNALKHACGGRMSLSERGGVLRVRVTDDGAGIDALQLPRATLMRGFSTRASMGLGFTLMHEMSDRLCLATDESGTTLIMEMAIHPESELDRALSMLKAEEF